MFTPGSGNKPAFAKVPRIEIPDPSTPGGPVGPVGPVNPVDPVGPVGPGTVDVAPVGPCGPLETDPKISQTTPVHIQALPEIINLSPISGEFGKSSAVMIYA
jgi:hypothetical protein